MLDREIERVQHHIYLLIKPPLSLDLLNLLDFSIDLDKKIGLVFSNFDPNPFPVDINSAVIEYELIAEASLDRFVHKSVRIQLNGEFKKKILTLYRQNHRPSGLISPENVADYRQEYVSFIEIFQYAAEESI